MERGLVSSRNGEVGLGFECTDVGLMRPHVAFDVCRDQDRRRLSGGEVGSCMAICARACLLLF